jgi:hypothetical protein
MTMSLLTWYGLIGSCVACYVLGALHTLAAKPNKTRCLFLALAAGFFWPLTLILGMASHWAAVRGTT